MRRIIFILFTLMLLTACNTNNSILSMSELEVVPDDVQAVIDPQYTLQLIFEGENIAYVVYQSKGQVVTDLEEQGDTLKVKLQVTKEDDVIEQHVYKLTLDDKHEVIDALINGESASFDSVTGL